MCKDTGEIIPFRQGKNSQNSRVSHIFCLHHHRRLLLPLRRRSLKHLRQEEEEEDADSFDGEHRLEKKPVDDGGVRWFRFDPEKEKRESTTAARVNGGGSGDVIVEGDVVTTVTQSERRVSRSRSLGFNVFLVASTFPFMSDVLCVYCSACLGYYYVSSVESIPSTYRVLRRKLHGPEGSDDEGLRCQKQLLKFLNIIMAVNVVEGTELLGSYLIRQGDQMVVEPYLWLRDESKIQDIISKVREISSTKTNNIEECFEKSDTKVEKVRNCMCDKILEKCSMLLSCQAANGNPTSPETSSDTDQLGLFD
ncbi:hypothetical protein Bca4012_009603 [Brassica carinata]